MLTFYRVMFTSHGNIRRKRKAPRVPPKPNSDRMVMKKLRDERMRQATSGAEEQNDTNNHRASGVEEQNHDTDNHTSDHARNEVEIHVDLWQEDYDNDQNHYNHDQHGNDDGEDSDSASGSDSDSGGDNDNIF